MNDQIRLTEIGNISLNSLFPRLIRIIIMNIDK